MARPAVDLYSKFGYALEEEENEADKLYSKFGVVPTEPEEVEQPGLQHELAQTYTDAEGNIRPITKVPGMLGGAPIIQGILGSRGFKKGALDVLSSAADHPVFKAPVDAIGGLFDTPGEGRDWTDVGQSLRELAQDRYGVIPGQDTWEKVKEAEGLAKIPAAAKYALTQTPSMTAYTAGALLAPGVMTASENQRLSVERAVNDNRISPELGDYMLTAPQSVLNIFLDRLPFFTRGGPLKRFGTGLSVEAFQGGTEVPSTKWDTEAWLGVPANQRIMEIADAAAAEAVAAGPLEAAGAAIDLSERRARPIPTGTGEVEYDEVSPDIPPDVPTGLLPPGVPTVPPTQPAALPPPVVPTDVQPPQRPDVIPLGGPVAGDVGIGEPTVETPQVAIEGVEDDYRADRPPAYEDRVPGDPLARPSAWSAFRDLINDIPDLKNIRGGLEAQNNYMQKWGLLYKNLVDVVGQVEVGEVAAELLAKFGLYSSDTKTSIFRSSNGELREIEITESIGPVVEGEEGIPEATHDVTPILAALFETQEGLFKAFNIFMEAVASLDGEFSGGLNRKLKVNIDLTNSGGGTATYDAKEHVISINLSTLQEFANGQISIEEIVETATHESTHKGVWSFWIQKAMEKIAKTGVTSPTKDQVIAEAVRMINEWGMIVVPMMKSDLYYFISDDFIKYGKEIFGRQLANRLNLIPSDPLYKELAKAENVKEAEKIILNAIKNGVYTKTLATPEDFALLERYKQEKARLLDRVNNPEDSYNSAQYMFDSMGIDLQIGELNTIDSSTTLAYMVIQEMLAYKKIDSDLVLGEKGPENKDQQKFLVKFLRAARNAFKKVLRLGEITMKQTRDFVHALLLEAKGAIPEGTVNQSELIRAYDELSTPETYAQANRPRDTTARDRVQPLGMAKDEEIDIGRRRFMKQGAGIAAGAAVDPTILAEPAAEAAAAVVEPPAISTIYRLAVSIPVETQGGDLVEGEAIVDIEYDSAENTLSVNELDEDGGTISEDTFQVPIENPTMRQVDDFAANIIKTGTNPMDPNASQVFDPKAVYSVQPPMREANQEEDAYKAADLDYLEGIGGEVSGVEPVNPIDTKVEDFGYQAQFEETEVPPSATLEGELRTTPEISKKIKPKKIARKKRPVIVNKIIDRIPEILDSWATNDRGKPNKIYQALKERFGEKEAKDKIREIFRLMLEIDSDGDYVNSEVDIANKVGLTANQITGLQHWLGFPYSRKYKKPKGEKLNQYEDLNNEELTLAREMQKLRAERKESRKQKRKPGSRTRSSEAHGKRIKSEEIAAELTTPLLAQVYEHITSVKDASIEAINKAIDKIKSAPVKSLARDVMNNPEIRSKIKDGIPLTFEQAKTILGAGRADTKPQSVLEAEFRKARNMAKILSALFGEQGRFQADHIIPVILRGLALHTFSYFMPIPSNINGTFGEAVKAGKKIIWENSIPYLLDKNGNKTENWLPTVYFTNFKEILNSIEDSKYIFAKVSLMSWKLTRPGTPKIGGKSKLYSNLSKEEKETLEKEVDEILEKFENLPEENADGSSARLTMNLEEDGKKVEKIESHVAMKVSEAKEILGSINKRGIEERLDLYDLTPEEGGIPAIESYLKQAVFTVEAPNTEEYKTNFHSNNLDMGDLNKSKDTHDKAKEYKQSAGWHQNAFTTFAAFMWSKPVEIIRRYRYASKTMGMLADLIQRDINETKRIIKGGLDYIQRRGMALGQFRVALQSTLDKLTGRTGVMSKSVNDAIALYLVQGTPIKNPKIAAAAEELKRVLESIYTWSQEVGTAITSDFSLRPLDGGLLPRVWNIEELATPRGRKRFMELLAEIGITDNLNSENEFEQTAATDAYNIALNSGGFISGDFTTTAYNQKNNKRRKYQVDILKKIEKEISRRKLGTLLVNDIQAALPRFVDKAVEKTLYANLFGHYDEGLWEMKDRIDKEIRAYNNTEEGKKKPVSIERAMRDINEMMDLLRHRFKMDAMWFNPRRYLQWFTNFTTVTLMPFVSLASMPEFFTPLMLGSKNPVGFVNDFRSVSWYAALRAMNGMSKLFRGKQLDAMLYPKGKAARRAMFLKSLGIIDIKSQGEAAAMRYIGPSFIRTGIAAQGPGAKMGIKALYKLYGLGDEATGRFRARKIRSLMNMDTYFEIVFLTTLTQMQQLMAANNLRRFTLSILKSLSKSKKGQRGVKLKSTIKQQRKILRDFGLTDLEIEEAIRWYEAGHREFYDVPAEFKWDPSGMTLRFVDQVITRPNEATMAKAFRHPAMAPILIFKSFMTTFGNTFMVAMRDRVKFAEGEGTEKTYQQAKMAAGYLATIGAMYGMVMFAQAIRHMLQYDDDEDNYMDDVPSWKKFIAMLNRTGLLTAPGSQLVDIFLPYKYGWWQKGGERAQDVILGPAYGQAKEIVNLITDLANKGEVNLEKFLARIAPITKFELFRNITGTPSYYEKD